MGTTEVMNVADTPDIARGELPFLESMGFRHAYTPATALRHVQAAHASRPGRFARANDNSAADGSVESSASSASSSASTSSTGRSASSAENAAAPDLKTKTKLPSRPQSKSSTVEGVPRGLSGDTDLQAGRLTSFIARMKYLSDEGEMNEIQPMVFPVGGSLADKRNLIKSQAARTRNQLELKFHSIPFFMQLESLGDGARERSRYNPLQIIRDRKLRPHLERDRPAHRVNMWQITVSEQVQDMRWRYQCSKIKAQKLKRRQRKSGTGSDSLAECAVVFDELPENIHDGSERADSSGSYNRRSSWASTAGGGPHFTNPFFTTGTRRKSQGSDGPTLLLPESSGTELIDRLRSSHGPPVPASGDADDDGSASASASDKASPGKSLGFIDMYDEDPLSNTAALSASSRRLYCRNTANVADTWNRMNSHASSHKSSSNGGGSAADDELLKPLAKVPTHTSQTFSIHSARSSVSGSALPSVSGAGPEIFQLDTASNSSASLVPASDSDRAPTLLGSAGGTPAGSSASSRTVAPAPAPPLLTVTSEKGENHKLESPLKRTTKGGNLGAMKNGSPQKTADLLQKVSSATDLDMSNPGRITFGSIRPGHVEVRKAPWERAAHTAEEELEYNILLFKNALRREEFSEARSRIWAKTCSDNQCSYVSVALKNDGVPQFLNYLSTVEQKVVSQQQILDADFAASLDSLRVTTDRMVSEVNTTLNKQVREISSRVEKLTSKTGSCCRGLTYTMLEYVVLTLMWAIWCVVKIWRLVTGGFHILRGGCNMLIIA